MPRSVVHSAGDCPTCLNSGALLLMIGNPGTRLVVYCPSCGCAWESLDQAKRGMPIASLRDLRISHIRPATRGEVEGAGIGGSIVESHDGDYMHWSRMR